jgi:ABC-type transporter Mla maintaining outer membrane lipid asymmetry ATPase subunit MlaF
MRSPVASKVDVEDPSTSGDALSVSELTGPAGRVVLHDVSLSVPRGATHVVIGAMHSGKSLLLRLVLGLKRASRGRVSIAGDSFDAAMPNEDELRRLRRRVGVVFDSSALVSRLTLLENVELPLVEHTDARNDDARAIARERLREAGVAGDVDRTPDRVSRLDRRRTALARALVLRPTVLLIDEPGHGLDDDATAELDDTIERLLRQYECAALICSQEVRYIFRFPSAVSVLAGGTLVDHGTLEQLRESRHAAVRRLVDRRGAA